MSSEVSESAFPFGSAFQVESWLQQCLQLGWRRLAFIGTTKHAGKTTALHRLLSDSSKLGYAVGLCSVGVDGERLDTLIGVEKPAIYVQPGMWVASAERALAQSDATLEWVEATGIHSPLGEVVLARVTGPGRILLAGIRQRAHVAHILKRFEEKQCLFQFIDGAFDRLAAAAPDIVDAAVLAVGAVAGKTVEDVADFAAGVLYRFQIPVLLEGELDAVRTRLQPAMEQTCVGLLNPQGELSLLPRHATATGLLRHPLWKADTSILYLPGAVTDGLLRELLTCPAPIHLVAAHPVQVLASMPVLRQYYRRGHRLSVWRGLPLSAISVNPHHILGTDLPRLELLRAIQQISGGIPVFNAFDEEASR